MDEIVDLVDRMGAMTKFEFAIEWGALTDAERDEVMALLEQRTAHGKERLERLEENARAYKALLVLLVRSDAPPGMLLPEAIGTGYVGIREVVETINGAAPDFN
jgi:predicted Fe-S protein YdhL (DUF1289 family)